MFFYAKKSKPDAHRLLIKEQSEVSMAGSNENETMVYRSRLTGMRSPLLLSLDERIFTLKDVLYQKLWKVVDKSELHFIKSTGIERLRKDNRNNSISLEKFMERARNFGAGLRKELEGGKTEKEKEKDEKNKRIVVAILLEPRIEWVISYVGSIEENIILVPLQQTDNIERINQVLKNSGASAVITNEKWAEKLKKGSKNIKRIVVTSKGDKKQDGGALLFEKIEEKGANVKEKGREVDPQDVSYILYNKDGTDGTSITHSNAVSVFCSYITMIPNEKAVTEKDRIMIVESMADATAINLINVALYIGCGLILVDSDDGEKLISQMEELKPTIAYFPQAIIRDLSSLMESFIEQLPRMELFAFKRGMNFVRSCIKDGYIPGFSFWDLCFFMHYRILIGGKLRLVYTVGNGQSEVVKKIIEIFGCQVFSTDGPNTCCGAVACGLYGDYQQHKYPSVGPPLPCCEIKLVDYPPHFATSDSPNPQGLLVVRGANVSQFKWNSSYALDSSMEYQPDFSISETEGWVQTNLLASFQPNRTLTVLGSTDSLSYDFIPVTQNNGKTMVSLSLLEGICFQTKLISDIILSYNPTTNSVKATIYPRSYALLQLSKNAKKPFSFAQVSENAFCKTIVYNELWRVLISNGIDYFDFKLSGDSTKQSESRIPFNVVLTNERFTRSSGHYSPDGSPNRLI
ncbi:Long-chain-fatty-acid-CoA ligase 4 [Zancudomyces culisetae]|uniref:Long-chain-fatty-acid-CoA ligase 4 n=1 Tax=Zancudomyces culisetae TaxID=1213189 RepID=A0A1R1PNH3_ZANCU|nr:Long-chain-fatty-acid-CoA ligase 4 [Zancudomyces culisetae]|eukprot:OMH82519.1 Long-chain-fatty-acid-CoA ligase 4 [Zancudomyces culisetae]